MLNINDDDYEAGLKNINKATKWPDERLIRHDSIPNAIDSDINISNSIDSNLNTPTTINRDVKVQDSNSSLLSSNIWKVIRIIYTLLISFINSVIEWLFCIFMTLQWLTFKDIKLGNAYINEVDNNDWNIDTCLCNMCCILPICCHSTYWNYIKWTI